MTSAASILIADDQPDVLEALRLLLKSEGYRLESVTSPGGVLAAVDSREFDGRMYVAVIDDLHTNFARTERSRAAARKFIQERLGANDLMAIVHTAGATDANQEFTNNKRLLLAAVDKTNGRKLDSATANRTNWVTAAPICHQINVPDSSVCEAGPVKKASTPPRGSSPARHVANPSSK